MAKKTRKNKRDTRSKTPKPASPRLRFPTKTRLRPIARHEVRQPLSFTPTVRERTVKILTISKSNPKPQKNKYAVLQPTKTPLAYSNAIKVCQKRTLRKQLAHALGFAGKSGQKKPNNKTREIKCS